MLAKLDPDRGRDPRCTSREGAPPGEAAKQALLGDWGTTRLRLLRVEGGRVVERREGPGIGQLASAPADALLAALGDWIDAARRSGLTLCGMAGSRNGLAEIGYLPCPADRATWIAGAGTIAAGGVPIRLAAGLRTRNLLHAPDVMRGEETQIFGAVAAVPALAEGRHLLVLPGTHSKWAVVRDGRIEQFHTAPTGELFALLRRSTLLLRDCDPAEDAEGFAAGLARAGSSRTLLAALFEARSAQLLEARPGGWASGFASGLLIGAEIAELAGLLGEAFPSGAVQLVAEPPLGTLYARALAWSGRTSRELAAEACTLAGLALLDGMGGEEP